MAVDPKTNNTAAQTNADAIKKAEAEKKAAEAQKKAAEKGASKAKTDADKEALKLKEDQAKKAKKEADAKKKALEKEKNKGKTSKKVKAAIFALGVAVGAAIVFAISMIPGVGKPMANWLTGAGKSIKHAFEGGGAIAEGSKQAFVHAKHAGKSAAAVAGLETGLIGAAAGLTAGVMATKYHDKKVEDAKKKDPKATAPVKGVTTATPAASKPTVATTTPAAGPNVTALNAQKANTGPAVSVK